MKMALGELSKVTSTEEMEGCAVNRLDGAYHPQNNLSNVLSAKADRREGLCQMFTCRV